ncbi:MAG: MupA/Atu3671 family FMN-dependent luciferase-like monooxygenase, partial [Myxococcota bacterium]
LDHQALTAATQALFAEHPALRTSFFAKGLERPVQAVRKQVIVPWRDEDWSALSTAEHRRRWRDLVAEEMARGFELTAAPLSRFIRVALHPQSHRILWVYHALALDRDSAQLCADELCRLYTAERGSGSAGESSPRSGPRPRYRSFITWLSERELSADRQWWRHALAGDAAVVRSGRTDDDTRAERGSLLCHHLTLSIRETEAVQSLLRTAKVSIDVALAGAWALVLAGRADADASRFGVCVRNRPFAEASTVAGRFATVAPVRLVARSEQTAAAWLGEVRSTLSNADTHAFVAHGHIAEEAGLAGPDALYDSVVVLAVQPAQDPAIYRTRGLAGFDNFTAVTSDWRVPLVLEAQLERQLTVRFRHDSSRVSNAEMIALATQLGAVLRGLAEGPQRPISTVHQIVRDCPPSGLAPAGEDGAGAAATAIAAGAPGPAEWLAVLRGHPRVAAATLGPAREPNGPPTARVVAELEPERKLSFSLFFFADDRASEGADKYRILLDGARFADRHGFEAVWTPERHFHEKGGVYPNPSVLSAALATITERIHLRAGSVALPLHNPLRVAEEWSVVDNLSGGRVGVAFTSGWVPNDFALAPNQFSRKRELMFDGIERIKALWSGNAVSTVDGVGNATELHTFPRPIQPSLPMWMTCSGSSGLFETAGEMGMHVLCALLTQSIEELSGKIAGYRAAWQRRGEAPGAGRVTLMLHTYVGADDKEVLRTVRAPFIRYLRSHVGLLQTMVKSLDMKINIEEPQWLDYLADFGFERYYRSAALIGTPTSSLHMIDQLIACGIDEVGCLIDFGVGVEQVLASLSHLYELKRCVDDSAHCTIRQLNDYLAQRFATAQSPLSIELDTASAN